MNKREFILAVGACAITLPATAALSARPRVDLPGGADARGWQARLGQCFELGDGEAARLVMLTAVREHASSARHAQFTLVFDGAAKPLPDGIHVLRHAGGQRNELFVESIDSKPGRLIAQFSLLA